jgi:large subunit ribosomal protein L23
MKTFFVQPLITEKSLAKAAENIYQFVTPNWASKPQIADHIAKHFNVTVLEVRTSAMKGQNVRFKAKAGQKVNWKKATLTLKKGDSIADFALPVDAQVDNKSAAPSAPMNNEKVMKAEKPTQSKITVRSKASKKALGGEK